LKKEIIISEANDLACVFEDGRAAEFFLRSGDQLVGDIIWGQVEAVVPGIEAAFVNIGQERNGFIHVADLPSAQAPRKQAAPKRPSIRVRERILVQIAKAPTGSKGARLTGRLTIPGRFLVLVPDDNRVSISRRIVESVERERLRRLTLKLKDPGHGLIVRTEAIGRSEDDLRQDIEELIDIWGDILHQVQIVNPPALLHRDSDLIHRVLRDATTGDVSKVVVDSAGGYQKACEILSGWMPELERHVSLHKGPHSLMQRYRISEELEAAISPKVWLPSGGSLVIEHTEALTVIDVNSSRSTQSRSLADTVLKTNMEAATEVARQLRLRDIGGIVVIDFISMDAASDRNKVLQAFHEALKQDKSRPQVTNFSEHGLIEVSRRRQGQNLLEQLTAPCEACEGTGRIRVSPLLTQEEGVRVAARAFEEEEGGIEELSEQPFAEELVLADGTVDDEDAEGEGEGEGEGGDGSRRRRRRRGRGRGRGRVGENGVVEGVAGTEGFVSDEEDEEVFLPAITPVEPVRGRGGRTPEPPRRVAAEPAARGPRQGGRAPIQEIRPFEDEFEDDLSLVEEVSLGDMFAVPAAAPRSDRDDRPDRGGRGRGRDRGGFDRGGERPFNPDRAPNREPDRAPAARGGDRPFERGNERPFDRDRAASNGGFNRGGGDRERPASTGASFDRDRDAGRYERDRERPFDRNADRGPREPREPRPVAPAARHSGEPVPMTDPNAFTVSAPAPRTRRVERRPDGEVASPVAVRPVEQSQTARPAARNAAPVGRTSEPVSRPPARQVEPPARPVAAAPERAPAERTPVAVPAPAPKPAAVVAKAPVKSAKPESKARTAPLPIPEQVEQIGVPGVFLLKKKPVQAATETKPVGRMTSQAAASDVEAEDDKANAKRRATPTRRATVTKVSKPEIVEQQAQAKVSAPSKAKSPAAKAATPEMASAKPSKAKAVEAAPAVAAQPVAKKAAPVKKVTK
jgi:ribonuclease E